MNKLSKCLLAAFCGVCFAIAVSTLVVVLQLSVAIAQGQRLADELAWYAYAQNVSGLHTQKAARDALAAIAGPQGHIEKLRADLRNDFRDAAAQLAGGMKYGFGTVNYQLVGLQALADAHLTEMGSQVAAVTGPAAQMLNQTETLLVEMNEAAQVVNAAMSQVNESLPLLLDCEGNADCLHNRWVGTARAVERAAGAIERTAAASAEISESCPLLRRVFLGCAGASK